MFKKQVMAGLIVATMGLALSACGGNQTESESTTTSESKVEDVSEDTEQSESEEETEEETEIEEETEEETTEEETISFEEGERIDFGTHTVDVGGISVTAEQLKTDDPLEATGTFDGEFGIAGDNIYWIDGKELKLCSLDGDRLSVGEVISLPLEPKEINSSNNDSVFVSSQSGSELYKISGNELISTYEDAKGYVDHFVMNPSGTFGVAYFLDNPLQAITIDGDTFTSEEISLPEGVSANKCYLSDSHIFVMVVAKSEEPGIYVFDYSGNLEFTLGGVDLSDDSRIASATAVVESDNYIIVIEGNLRKFIIFDKNGEYIGMTRLNALLGTNYPWPVNAAMMSDGSILLGVTEDRSDDSGKEYIFYKVYGF